MDKQNVIYTVEYYLAIKTNEVVIYATTWMRLENTVKWKMPDTKLVYSVYYNTIPQTGWLKQQKLIFSEFWRLEVRDQGARVGFW